MAVHSTHGTPTKHLPGNITRIFRGPRKGLTEDLWPLISLLTYQSLPCDLSSLLTAIVLAPLPTANFVPGKKNCAPPPPPPPPTKNKNKRRNHDICSEGTDSTNYHAQFGHSLMRTPHRKKKKKKKQERASGLDLATPPTLFLPRHYRCLYPPPLPPSPTRSHLQPRPFVQVFSRASLANDAPMLCPLYDYRK